ncbi:MAG: hypothetical protein DRI57_17405 [Deltaproteobacteria bacterium]|nr:MAG: hypothetical protein DRI57_17405 [Deltaproteobacteria bacterium]
MEVTGEKYNIRYDSPTGTIVCGGIMDMRGKEGYKEVAELFEKVVNEEPETVTLDIRKLEFLNSSGITTIGAKLVIRLRNKKVSKLVIRCSKAYPWHEKSVKGLTKLMPALEVRFH